MPTQDPTTGLRLDNQFSREVQGMYVRWQPEPAPAPRWLQFNDALESKSAEVDLLLQSVIVRHS